MGALGHALAGLKVHLPGIAWAALSGLVGLSTGCSSFVQRDLNDDPADAAGVARGIIIGSVTAPYSGTHHETVYFHYRSMDDDGKHAGVLSSGTRNPYAYPRPFVPLCSETELPRQCGRLYAMELPAGHYRIHRVELLGRGAIHHVEPLSFSVLAGQVSYLGDLHVSYCAGMVTRHRGNILGADISVRDEFARDTALLKQKYPRLGEAVLHKHLLPDPGWTWRASFKTLFVDGAPQDWGDCSPPQPASARPSG